MDFNSDEWLEWAQLMRRAQDGDLEAYSTLLSRVSPMLFNYVRKRVFHADQAKDIYQDVLLKIHKARHTYQPSRPLGPWLFAVARSVIWTSLSKSRKFREKEVPMENLAEGPWAAEAEFLGEQGMDDRLRLALDALPENNRRAVEMLKLEGKDLESAARELGVSRLVVKVRAHRGYVKLRKLLGGGPQ